MKCRFVPRPKLLVVQGAGVRNPACYLLVTTQGKGEVAVSRNSLCQRGAQTLCAASNGTSPPAATMAEWNSNKSRRLNSAKTEVSPQVTVLEMGQWSWAQHQHFELLIPAQILAQLRSVGIFSLTFSPWILQRAGFPCRAAGKLSFISTNITQLGKEICSGFPWI